MNTSRADNEAAYAQAVDRQKLRFEFAKHISTLSLACIVLLSGFYERIFFACTNSHFTFCAFAVFVLALLLSFLAMNRIIDANLSEVGQRDAGSILVGLAAFLIFFGITFASLITNYEIENKARSDRAVSTE